MGPFLTECGVIAAPGNQGPGGLDASNAPINVPTLKRYVVSHTLNLPHLLSAATCLSAAAACLSAVYTQSAVVPVISRPSLRGCMRLQTYCRTKCTPVLSASAAGVLKDHYVQIRQTLVGAGREDGNDPDAPPPAIPITVRQLEAIVRMSEALAKMRLLDEVHDEQVREAIRIFQVSTLAASKSGACLAPCCLLLAPCCLLLAPCYFQYST